MARVRLLLLDACVLIDFAKSDSSVLTLASRHLGQVHVPTPLLEEVKELDAAMAVSLGITLLEPNLETAAAAATRRGRLSFEDHLCLLMAKEGGFTCVSNDRQLRSACQTESVPVLWGLELLAELVAARALPATSARDIARTIVLANRRMGRDVYVRFLARIGLKE